MSPCPCGRPTVLLAVPCLLCEVAARRAWLALPWRPLRTEAPPVVSVRRRRRGRR